MEKREYNFIPDKILYLVIGDNFFVRYWLLHRKYLTNLAINKLGEKAYQFYACNFGYENV